MHRAAKCCLKRFSPSLMKETVSTLLTFSTGLLDIPNDKGTKCRTLVNALQAKLERQQQTAASSTSSESDNDWNDKLAEGLRDDIGDEFGSLAFQEDDEADRETFDSWADRIYREYHRKRRAVVTSQTAKPKQEKDSAFVKRDKPLKTEAVKRELKYRTFLKQLDQSDKLRVKDLPFTTDSSAASIVNCILEGVGEDGARAEIRKALLLWHPDKMKRNFGSKFCDSEALAKVVTHVSQALTGYGK